MGQARKICAEAAAVARIAEAAREVQAASVAIEPYYRHEQSDGPSTLLLARLTAALAELQQAREAFTELMASGAGSPE